MCWSPSCASGWVWKPVSIRLYRFLVSPFSRKRHFAGTSDIRHGRTRRSARVGGSDSRMACVHRIGIAGACFGPDCFCTHSGENRAISDQRVSSCLGKIRMTLVRDFRPRSRFEGQSRDRSKRSLAWHTPAPSALSQEKRYQRNSWPIALRER